MRAVRPRADRNSGVGESLRRDFRASRSRRYTAKSLMLRDRVEQVEQRIMRAAQRAGRKRSDITLIAVTKKFPAQTLIEAYELGLRHFGENYVQEFEAKRPILNSLTGAQFHLIGHLQSNKARAAADLFDVIETVDSGKIARRLDQAVKDRAGEPLEVMIEVKLSQEEAKFGAPPEALPALIAELRGCAHLRLTGLMTIPPWNEDQEQTRPYFKRLFALAQEHGLKKISMGMSNDFEAAIEEGATHIRVGTALFGPRRRE
jgi:pyridoxal phosphate enzyme (YggS family)